MGIFATTRDIGKLRARIEELEDDVSTLQRKASSLNLEFTELYDKVSHQMSRMAKRYAAREKTSVEETLDLPDGVPVDGTDPISQSILLRRGRMGGQK